MSDKHEKQEQQEPILELEEAQHMTVEEAKRKESDLQAGIADEDSVLDRYIKRHREEIATHKYGAEPIEPEPLDTSALDKFIQKQKEELAASGLLTDGETVVPPVKEPVFDEIKPVDVPKESVIEQPVDDELNSAAEEPIFLSEEIDEELEPKSKNKKVIFGALSALVIGIFGLSYGLNRFGQQATSTLSSSTKSTQSSSKKTKKAKAEDLKAFNDAYQAFFIDSEQTKLKNSEFENLANLEMPLKKLEGTSDYASAKAKYDKLSKAIVATKKVNDQFDSPVIVDGEQVADIPVKAGADFAAISTSDKTTGNASLDSLLQKIIANGKEQQTVAANQTAPIIPVQPTPTTPNAVVQDTAPIVSQPVVPTAPTVEVVNWGIQEYNPAILQRHLSRVPYNEATIADKGNPSWVFNPGIMENIIRVSQERGYITGYNFILEPVNIINGNGYYNMFKPDGTYLFSINCKTGYFVGNAPGYAEDLDF